MGSREITPNSWAQSSTGPVYVVIGSSRGDWLVIGKGGGDRWVSGKHLHPCDMPAWGRELMTRMGLD